MPPRRSSRSATKKAAGDKRKQDDVKGEEEKPEVEEKSTEQADGDAPAEGDAAKVEDSKDEVKAEAENEDEDVEPPKKAAKTSSPLDWLLSAEAFNMANPEIPQGHGEIDWDEESGKKTPPAEDAGKKAEEGGPILRYPQSHLTPFQNLIAACLLSKPISHKLGLRTIQTLLNPPFGLRTLSDIDEAGYEGRRKVMWEARTQHKEKTATQLGEVCEGIKELCGDDASEEDYSGIKQLKDKLKDCKNAEEAQKEVVDTLTQIKYIGPGVAAIFLRRVQGDWEEVFPYADDRSLKAARELELIDDNDGAEELAKKVDMDRGKFVKLLDVLVGLDLEKKLPEAKEKALA